jgi:hypothetical protein
MAMVVAKAIVSRPAYSTMSRPLLKNLRSRSRAWDWMFMVKKARPPERGGRVIYRKNQII